MEAAHVQEKEEEEEAPASSKLKKPCSSYTHVESVSQREVSSCVSLKSERSMPHHPAFPLEPRPAHTQLVESVSQTEVSSCVSLKSERSMPHHPAFPLEPGTEQTLQETAAPGPSSCPLCGGVLRGSDSTSHESWCSCATSGWDTLQSEHKRHLEQSCESVSEGAQKERTSLSRIYTELYITEGHAEEVPTQHEEMQLETLSKRTVHHTAIRCQDIFKPLHLADNNIRVVLTYGVAGVGKTFSVLKFTLDWAQGMENQELALLVLLSFRALNLVREECRSLLQLIHMFHPSLQQLSAHTLTHSKVLFICDGLDESRLALDFSSGVITEVTQRSEVSVLLVNLIRGTLLPNALIWITSRPAAANQIRAQYVHRVTEVRGFTDDQKKEYFMRRFCDEEQCKSVLSHIKSSRSLHVMCQIPVFCWITATVLEHLLRSEQCGALPQTLTDMYSSFLLVQTQRKRKYRDTSCGPELTTEDCELLLKLGRLAFKHLQRGNIMFYQEDLQKVGLEEVDTLVHSGLCTEIFKQESVFDRAVYCFIHLSVQEFLAAVYTFHRFRTHTSTLQRILTLFRLNSRLEDFLKKALLKSFQSPSGHLDLYVRFLHGLTLDSNQRRLGALLGPALTHSDSRNSLIHNLKEMSTKSSPDRSLNIFHCLTELKDHSVHQQIQDLLRSEDRSEKLSVVQCSALAYMLQVSAEVLEELNLHKYKTSAEGRLRLLPAVRNCTRAVLSQLELSKPHCDIVVSALKADPSLLRELDLSKNTNISSVMNSLCKGLASANCRLETLRLKDCNLSESSCFSLGSALKLNPSYLKELDLRNNWDMKDSGVDHLCGYLRSPDCRLDTLRLSSCSLSERSCASLASALSLRPSHLRLLDVGWNRHLGDPGVQRLCVYLQSQDCGLEILRLNWCGVSGPGCSSLALAKPSSLTHLDLGGNDQLDDRAVEHLCGFLRSPLCRLETLRLNSCGVSRSGCSSLASALCSNSHLKEINLWYNLLNDSDLQPLYQLVRSPQCPLESVLR
ncbi:hypothetical protein NL108_018278 [Boleophthalmus pectinirostris]|nr:NACHT, LRR and PYD domains-containing protein 12-like isoform X2 [Boleophthalmus pectinirostris]XP_055012765.1 NACHT, LRR and PYD domains-containing protein 12-like isoform X2 [Boleophthalmus pectinirostris]KAJ0070724.1 hypothetical protein NL108_018278 [Boleophthalmus pectinirostris]